MNKSLVIAANLLLLTGCGGSEYAQIEDSLITTSADGVGSFYECFDQDYNETVVLSEDAYLKGECFMTLTLENSNLNQSSFNEAIVGADKHTVLQYADSWYYIAANKGHPIAKLRVDHSQLALYAMEDGFLAIERAKHELLASEKEFKFLDADESGLLTLEEVLANQELAQSFSSSDFDEDGKISIEEYIIYSGEATAAGHEKPLQDQLE
mgnify:CR=1 FL=1